MDATQDSPQLRAIHDLTGILQRDEAVRGLLLIGSYARPGGRPDIWSDVDLVLVVADDALQRFHPETAWLASLGEIYASSLSKHEHYDTVRVFFTDHRHLDVVVVPEAALESIDEWNPNPLRDGAKCLFSRSPLLDNALDRLRAQPEVPECSSDLPCQIADDFWFKGMLAVEKVARGDLLVAAHLALDMMRDCCMLRMILRDRQTATGGHKEGGEDSQLLARFQSLSGAFTAPGILHAIAHSAAVFDDLASELSSDYRARRGPLLEWVERVRESLANGR